MEEIKVYLSEKEIKDAGKTAKGLVNDLIFSAEFAIGKLKGRRKAAKVLITFIRGKAP